MRETTHTIVAFFQGAYGPTIRIDVQDIEWLKLLKNALTQLISKNISVLELLNLNSVEKDSISGFKIVLGKSADLSAVLNMQSKEFPLFIWTVDSEYIDWVIGAIEYYLEHNMPGHHYLYEDTTIIELAFKE